MERNLRFAAPVAGGAVVISLIVGLFAGVPVGTAVVRAVLSGGALGGLAFGAAVVARTQLPGIDGASEHRAAVPKEPSSESGDSLQQQTGSKLNIVVEDDDEVADADGQADSEGAEPEEPHTAQEAPRDGAAEQAKKTSPDVSSEPAEDEDGEAEELVEEVQESSADDEVAVMNAAISEEQDGTSVEIDDSMLDEMPDIGSFAGSFVSGDGAESDESGGAVGETGGNRGFSDGAKQKKGDPRKGFDNKTIAKALQTFMSKDSE